MLPAENRMRSSVEFERAFKGARGGSPRILVAISKEQAEKAGLPPKVGFVVPKSVGNSVVRHRIYRQLRHIMRERIQAFHNDELIVVRAFPPARDCSSTILAQDLDRCIDVARKKSGTAQSDNGQRKRKA